MIKCCHRCPKRWLILLKVGTVVRCHSWCRDYAMENLIHTEARDQERIDVTIRADRKQRVMKAVEAMRRRH